LLDGVVVVKKVALEVICTMANMSNYSKSFSFFYIGIISESL
jgi:hypothetical protein